MRTRVESTVPAVDPIRLVLVALLSFAYCAGVDAASKPLPDVVIDDTNVYPGKHERRARRDALHRQHEGHHLPRARPAARKRNPGSGPRRRTACCRYSACWPMTGRGHCGSARPLLHYATLPRSALPP